MYSLLLRIWCSEAGTPPPQQSPPQHTARTLLDSYNRRSTARMSATAPGARKEQQKIPLVKVARNTSSIGCCAWPKRQKEITHTQEECNRRGGGWTIICLSMYLCIYLSIIHYPLSTIHYPPPTIHPSSGSLSRSGCGCQMGRDPVRMYVTVYVSRCNAHSDANKRKLPMLSTHTQTTGPGIVLYKQV